MTEDSGSLPATLTDPFRVAEWEVEVVSHRIRRGDETVRLEPRTMAVLVYLAARPGQVVSREELEQEVWSGRVVGYEALSNTIAKLRRAFGDHPRQPRIIETVSKAGYRLVADVQTISEPAFPEPAGHGSTHVPDAGPDPPGKRFAAARKRHAMGRRQRLLALSGLAFVLLAIAGVVWHVQWNPVNPEAPSPLVAGTPSVAVLPFDNLSPDPAQDFFADGLTSDVITDLSRISGLFVIARHSVFAYENPSSPVTEVADELGVRYVVEGSVRRAEGRIRINAQLIDASTGMNLWAKRYERDEMEIFALRDEVIGDIVDTLAVTLTDAERMQLAHRGTDDLEAYDYYLRARHRWHSCVNVGCEREVITLYRRAIALDPEFADAYAGIAEAALATWRWNSSNIMPGAAARRLAYDAASKVLSLDQDDPRAYTVLASIQAIEGQHEQALESGRSAVRLDPDSADAHAALAWVLTLTGNRAEARSEMKTALRANPRPSEWYDVQLGTIAFLNGDYENALASLSSTPDYFEVRLWRAMTYAELGRLAEARAEIKPTYENVPFANLAYYRTMFAHFKRDQDLEHMLGALAKAGIPEWPYGYEPADENQIDESELRRITVGHTWSGRDLRGNRFVQQFTDGDRVAFRGRASLLTGSYRLRENLLCVEYSGTLLGREDCGHVYRNPEGNPEHNNEFVRIAVGDIYYFSVSPN